MGIGIVVWLCTLTTDVVHDLVFTFSWNVGIRQDHLIGRTVT